MRLLIFTNLFPTPSEPENGVFTYQLAMKLARYCDVTVVVPLPWFPKIPLLKSFRRWYKMAEVPERYHIDGIEVFSPKYPLIPKISLRYQASLMSLGVRNMLKKLHRERRFDVINSHWIYPDSVSIDRLREELPIPHIATGLGCDVNVDIDDPRKGPQIQKAMKTFDHITVVSSSLKEVLLSHGLSDDKVTVITNGVDLDKFDLRDKKQCRSHLGLAQDKKIYLYVGRLSEEKGVEYFIDAFRIHLKQKPDSVLYMVGSGDLDGMLSKKLQAYGLSQQIILAGQVSHEEIPIWLGACDYFCLPSKREGCPNAVLEALASGRPVLASRVGAIPDFVENGVSGELFDPGNVEQAANALAKARTIDWNPFRIAETVSEQTWDHAAKAYLRVFEEIAGLKNVREGLKNSRISLP